MKKTALLISLIGLLSANVFAAGEMFDLFPYENRASSMTVDIDASKFNRFSIQVVYSTPVVSDVQITQAGISVDNNTILATGHGFGTAQAVHLASAPTTAPNPLTSGTTYYIIKITDNLVQLATTYAQALTGDEIDILLATSGNLTLRPKTGNLANAGYLWYGSNDATTWTAIASSGESVATSTQTLTVMGAFGGTRLHNWGEYAYKYLRLTFLGPAEGIIKLRALFYSRE